MSWNIYKKPRSHADAVKMIHALQSRERGEVDRKLKKLLSPKNFNVKSLKEWRKT